jgi:hypothetical protein
MSNRITDKQLQAVCDRINKIFGLPLTAYKPYDATVGRAQPNAGVYHLSHAYGGVALHRMSEREGCSGVNDVFSRGHMPKRELYELMHAFLRGVDTVKGD